jgi:hypothetical protein
MKKLAVLLLASPFALFCADESLPTAESVLNHFIDVTGGKAAHEKLHNQVEHGTMEFAAQGIKGAMTIYEAAPDQTRAVIELAGIGKIEDGSGAGVAWENSALQGPRIKSGQERTEALRDSTFNAILFWQKLYSKAETTGIETVEGQECYKIVMTPSEGHPTSEFYDKKSGLLIKTQATRASSMGDISAETVYQDYRKEGDLLLPHKLIQRAAGQEFQITVQSVEFNANLPAGTFDPPAEIQALLNKQPVKQAITDAVIVRLPQTTTGKLTIYMAGKPMGSETYSVTRADGKIELDGSGTAAIGPMKVDIQQFKVVTTDKYQLIEADAKAKLGQIQMNGKITFADGKARNEVDTGQGPQIKEDSVHSDAIVVNAQLPLYPWSLLAMRAELKNQDPQQFMVYVLNQGEVPATVVFKGREPVEFGGGKTEVLNHLNGSGKTPQGQAVSLDFWVDDNRKVIKILVPSMGVEAYQDGYDRKAPPAAPDAAAPKGE